MKVSTDDLLDEGTIASKINRGHFSYIPTENIAPGHLPKQQILTEIEWLQISDPDTNFSC